LFSLAKELNIAGDHIALSKGIEKELEAQIGKQFPINVDGAIAAISSDMDFDWRLGKAFFLLGRVAGLTAHVYEEQTEQKPMRQMFSVECDYDGPEEKDLP
jgi:citryl-CoA lyase